MVTLTYAELVIVVSLGMAFILVVGLVAQAFGSDDAIRSIVSQLRRRLRTKGFRTGWRGM